MPKMKTHSSTKKRFKITSNGKVKSNHSERSHRFVSKSKASKKSNRNTAYVSKSREANVKKMLPYA